MKANIKKIGEVWVDSGTMQIGDPCYDRTTPSWDDICERLSDDATLFTAGSDEPWGEGMGMLVNTHSDGVFPVYLELDGWGNPKSIRIVLSGDDEDDDEY